jgi:hypothetical protein
MPDSVTHSSSDALAPRRNTHTHIDTNVSRADDSGASDTVSDFRTNVGSHGSDCGKYRYTDVCANNLSRYAWIC